MHKSRIICMIMIFVCTFFVMTMTVLAGSEEITETGSEETTETGSEETTGTGSETESVSTPLVDNGIPVITLTIDPDEFQAVIDSEEHDYRAENCSIRIDVPSEYVCEYGSIDLTPVGTELPLEYIRGRGNATWTAAKKPFKFKLAQSEDLFSMGSNAHWVLLSNLLDGSLLRNRIASYIGNELGMEFTPRFVPVDFVVNDRYMGSYILGEQVRVDTNRVDIDKIKKSNKEEPEITGGYLLALNEYPDEEDISKITTKEGVTFQIDTPDFSEYSDSQQEALQAQREYIAQFLQEIEDAILGEGFRNSSGTYYGDLMDMESAAKFWWVQEVTGNGDAFRTPSNYLYKKRDGKLYWGPLWDFDMAFFPTSDNNEYIQGCGMFWQDYLRQYDPEYQIILRETWNELDKIIQEITRAGGVLDRYAAEIEKSWEMNNEVWPGGSEESESLNTQIEFLRNALESRRTAINEIVDTGLTRVLYAVNFMDDDVLLTTKWVLIDYPFPEEKMPEAPEKEGYSFVRWVDENGETFEPYQSVQSDKTVHAEYVLAEDTVKPDDSGEPTSTPELTETEVPTNSPVPTVSGEATDSNKTDHSDTGKQQTPTAKQNISKAGQGSAANSKSVQSSSVNTGDTSLPYFWVLLMIGSAACIGYVQRRIR